MFGEEFDLALNEQRVLFIRPGIFYPTYTYDSYSKLCFQYGRKQTW